MKKILIITAAVAFGVATFISALDPGYKKWRQAGTPSFRNPAARRVEFPPVHYFVQKDLGGAIEFEHSGSCWCRKNHVNFR